MSSVHPYCRLMCAGEYSAGLSQIKTQRHSWTLIADTVNLPLLLCSYPLNAWNVPEILFTSYTKNQLWKLKVEGHLKIWSTYPKSWTKQTSLSTGTWLWSRTSGLAQQGQIPFHGCRLDLQHQRSLQFINGCRSLIERLLLELQIKFSVWGNTHNSQLTLCPRVSWRPGWHHNSMSKKQSHLNFFFFYWENPNKLGYTRRFLVPSESRFKKLLRWVLPGFCISHTWGKALDLGRILGICPWSLKAFLILEGEEHSNQRGGK